MEVREQKKMEVWVMVHTTSLFLVQVSDYRYWLLIELQ